MHTIERLTTLDDAHEGSWYTIIGVGGDPQEWVTGYEDMLQQQGIGTPTRWLLTDGAAVNAYAGYDVNAQDQFQSDVTILMFPLDGLDVGRLAMFKIHMQDRWFDDVVSNMRRW